MHCAEVVEETPQGIQGLQVVARFHLASIICAECRACNDIERSLPKGLVESVLHVDFKQGPGLVCRVLLTVTELQDLGTDRGAILEASSIE